ncbi:MAG TPA: response regulator transcription factor [Pseudohongiella sp.]|nr:response regulator transcription factor [Pseudohongiella sp.]
MLILEDDPLVQQRLLAILHQLGYDSADLHFSGTLGKARTLIAVRTFALALIDLGLPDGQGTQLIAELRHQDAEVAILVISAWSTEDVIITALRAGASGYLLKERDDFEVLLSIRSVLRGGAPIDPFIARRLIAEMQTVEEASSEQSEDVLLSSRETEILRLVAGGLSNREIAEHLHISRHTVESHIKNIYRKLAVSSRIQAINEGLSRGLLG